MSSPSGAIAPASPTMLGRGAAAVTRQQTLGRHLPLWGMLLAAALIVSRRPDAVMHAQFWAEDGKLFYADVYNRGLLATLAVPQAGYFQELPTLAAGVARLVPLAFAPLAMNTIAIAIRVLPVGLLLCARAERISPDVRVRGLLAALYIALPGSPESNANVDNALWYLATAAVIVLMLRPSRSTRVLDIGIVTLCSVTGVFSIALAPLAFLYRRWRGETAVPRPMLVILAAGAAVQLLALFVLEYHLPSGFGAAPRPSVPLQATVPGFFQILGARVIAEPLLGNSVALTATTAAVLGVLAAGGALLAFRRGSAELKLMIGFGGALFTMAVAHPFGTSWPALALFPTGARYFIIPQYAAVAMLIWAVGYSRRSRWRVLVAGLVLCTCLVTVARGWAYPPVEETGFAVQASRFEHERSGTRMTFLLEPSGWLMTLVKH